MGEDSEARRGCGRGQGERKLETLKEKRVLLEQQIVVWKQQFDKKENEAREKAEAFAQAKALALQQKQIATESAKLNAVLSNLTTLMRDEPALEPVARVCPETSSWIA